MSTETTIAIISAVAALAVFLVVWWTGTRVQKAVRVLAQDTEANTKQTLAEATGIAAQLEEIRKDVNSNLTAALNHIELLEHSLVEHGLELPEKDPRV
jgi:predicted secreted protein